MELLANLAGTGKSPHYDDCLKALIAMGNHCFDKQGDVLHIIPYPYFQIAKNFFDIGPPEIELRTKNMAGVIGEFKR